MWLYGDNHEITEVGAMNIMFVIRSKSDANKVEVITASLTRGDILAGVTRDSIINIIKDWSISNEYKNDPLLNNISIIERTLTMAEIVEASSENRVRLCVYLIKMC